MRPGVRDQGGDARRDSGACDGLSSRRRSGSHADARRGAVRAPRASTNTARSTASRAMRGEQRQRARGGDRRATALERRVAHRVSRRRSIDRRPLRCGRAACGPGSRVSTSADGEAVRRRPRARPAVRDTARRTRPAAPRRVTARELRQRVVEAGDEAVVVRAEARRRLHRSRRDAPVARRRVVDRVVEARRRDQPIAGQLAADRIAVVAVARRRREDARKRRRIATRVRDRLEAGLERDLHALADAAALGRRQRRRGDEHGRRRAVAASRPPARRRTRPSPARPGPRRPMPSIQATTTTRRVDAVMPGAANSRLQFAPPKPNEFDNTRRSGRRRCRCGSRCAAPDRSWSC